MVLKVQIKKLSSRKASICLKILHRLPAVQIIVCGLRAGLVNLLYYVIVNP